MKLNRLLAASFSALLLAGTTTLIAAEKGPGASQFAPPHSTKNVPPGHGGTPPGQMLNDKRDRETTGQRPGASQYAPPHSKRNDPPGLGGRPPGQIMNDKK